MHYSVIARRYRPQTFAEVVGQQAVIQTLKNAIRLSRVGQAYLFSGSRGVGKTTVARLFAKALNCQERSGDCEPCNRCASCLEIAAGQSLDVIEIDGASNRGIDDVRQINETVAFSPTAPGRYKIYLIDEVHMLTKEAFNALLKTLEEPPPTAKFFFATTEPFKVLPTILSRCQRFDLGRISPSAIAGKLAKIAADQGREAEPGALELLARFADGALRDAESLFDQLLCFAEGKITSDAVHSALGLVPESLLFQLDGAFAAYDLPFAFSLVETLYASGRDLSHFLGQLVEHYRRLAQAHVGALPPESAARYEASARLYTPQQALAILDLLVRGEPAVMKSSFPRIALESLLLQLLRHRHKVPVEVLVRRLSELEEGGKRLEEQGETPRLPPAPPLPAAPVAARPAEPVAPPPAPAQPVLRPVPFAPLPPETPPPAPAAPSMSAAPSPQPIPPQPQRPEAPSTARHETLMRFAAVELEGTLTHRT
jgi:DNA polymerase-3 subunit gamma/tau